MPNDNHALELKPSPADQEFKKFTDSQNQLIKKHFRTDLQKQVSSGFMDGKNQIIPIKINDH